VFVEKKLSEQLGLHYYAVSTHPDEFVLETPVKKILDPPMMYHMKTICRKKDF